MTKDINKSSVKKPEKGEGFDPIEWMQKEEDAQIRENIERMDKMDTTKIIKESEEKARKKFENTKNNNKAINPRCLLTYIPVQSLISNFALEYDLAPEPYKKCIEIVDILKTCPPIHITTRGFLGMASAIIYITTRFSERKFTQRELTEIFGITGVTLRNWFKKIKEIIPEVIRKLVEEGKRKEEETRRKRLEEAEKKKEEARKRKKEARRRWLEEIEKKKIEEAKKRRLEKTKKKEEEAKKRKKELKELYVTIPDDLEQKVRRRFCRRRGDLSATVTKALGHYLVCDKTRKGGW